MLPSDPLQERFSGKRKADRVPCRLSIQLRSGRRSFPAEILDLSTTGALVRISYAAVAGAIGGKRAGTVINSIDRHFGGGGFEIEVPETGMVLPAVLVRMVMEVNEPDAFRLGCQFRDALDAAQIQHLTGKAPDAV